MKRILLGALLTIALVVAVVSAISSVRSGKRQAVLDRSNDSLELVVAQKEAARAAAAAQDSARADSLRRLERDTLALRQDLRRARSGAAVASRTADSLRQLVDVAALPAPVAALLEAERTAARGYAEEAVACGLALDNCEARAALWRARFVADSTRAAELEGERDEARRQAGAYRTELGRFHLDFKQVVPAAGAGVLLGLLVCITVGC